MSTLSQVIEALSARFDRLQNVTPFVSLAGQSADAQAPTQYSPYVPQIGAPLAFGLFFRRADIPRLVPTAAAEVIRRRW